MKREDIYKKIEEIFKKEKLENSLALNLVLELVDDIFDYYEPFDCRENFTSVCDVFENLMTVRLKTKRKPAYITIAIPNRLAEKIIDLSVSPDNSSLKKVKLFIYDEEEKEKNEQQ